MGKILNFPGESVAHVEPKWILEKAMEWNLRECLVIGIDKNENLVCGGTSPDIGLNFYLLEKTKYQFLLNTEEE